MTLISFFLILFVLILIIDIYYMVFCWGFFFAVVKVSNITALLHFHLLGLSGIMLSKLLNMKSKTISDLEVSN